MARRDVAQFDDAFEDAESDIVNPKSTLDPSLNLNVSSSVLQSNGELPESEKSESQCEEEIGLEEMNGALGGGDEDPTEEYYNDSKEANYEQSENFNLEVNENDYYVEPLDQFQTGEDMTESDNDRDYQEEVETEEVEDNMMSEGQYYPEDAPQDEQRHSGEVDGPSRECDEAEEDNLMVVVEEGLAMSNSRVEGMQDMSDEEADGEDFFEEVDDFYPGNQQNSVSEEELPQSEQAESDSYDPIPEASHQNPATHFSDYDVPQDYLEPDINCEQEGVKEEQEVVELEEPSPAPRHNLNDDLGMELDHANQGQSDSAEADQEEFSQVHSEHGYSNEPMAAESLAHEQPYNETLDLHNESTLDNKFINVVYPNVNRFPEQPVSTYKSDSTSESARQHASNQEEAPQKTVRPKSPRSAGRPGPRPTAGTRNSTTAQSQRGVTPPQATTTKPKDAQPTKPPVSTEQSTSQTPRSPTRRVPTRQQPSAHTAIKASPPVKKPQERREPGKGDMRGVGPGQAQRRQAPEANVAIPKSESSQQDANQDRQKEAQKPLPVPGGARPVASLKSRFQDEMKEIFDLEKNLSSSTFKNPAQETNSRRTQNGQNVKSALPGQRTSPVRARHNEEYASVSSLRPGGERSGTGLSTPGRAQAVSPQTNQTISQPGGVKTQPPKRSGPTSPANRIGSPPQMQATYPEPPRNNSNANNIPRTNPGSSALQRGRVADKYSFNVSELSDGANGEVVFDDCDECGAYLDERMGGAANSDGVTKRLSKSMNGSIPAERPRSLRRRNSYEMANRESSSEEDPDEGEYRVDEGYAAGSNEDSSTPSHQHPSRKEDLAVSSSGGKYDIDVDGSTDSDDRAPIIPPTGVDDNLLARLAARELANLWKSNEKNKQSAGSDSGVQPDSSRQSSEYSGPSPPTTPQELAAAGAKQDQRKANMPNVSPMEYDVVGLRLAGHAESNVNVSNLPPHPEEDQFSDADEEDEPKSGGGGGSGSVTTPDGFPERFNFSPGYKNLTLGSPATGRYPTKVTREPSPPPIKPVDVKDAMKELQQALSTSKTASMKTPSFYVQEQLPQPIWVMQPETAQKAADDDRRKRIMEERKRRQEELRVLRLKQREEYMKSTDPQCYQHIATDEDEETDEGLESKQLISNQDQAGGNYLNKQRLSIEPDMRAPDLPPATGRIQESRGPHDETALSKGIIYPAAYLGSTQLVTTKQPTKKVRMQQAQEAVNRIKDGSESSDFGYGYGQRLE